MGDDGGVVRAFLDRSRQLIVVPSHYDDQGSKFERAEVAISLQTHVREQLGESTVIDLDRTYPDNEVAETIRTKLLGLTAPSGPFRPSTERLTSGEVSARIKDDWSAFVSCPWASEIKGALAILKYLVEWGEKPRFWSENHEGHFGFRLRTRDHTWLVGELFVVSGEPAPTGKEPMAVISSREMEIARLGRLHLGVKETR